MQKLILGLCGAAVLAGCAEINRIYLTETARDWCRREVETNNMPPLRETARARTSRLARMETEYDACVAKELSATEQP